MPELAVIDRQDELAYQKIQALKALLRLHTTKQGLEQSLEVMRHLADYVGLKDA